MKQHRKLRLTLFICKLEGTFYKLCAVFQTNPEAYHHACIQINNHAYVKFLFFVAEIGYITDPDFIRASRCKLLIKIILAPPGFLIILLFRALTDTAQSHILHQLAYHAFADAAALLLQDGSDFSGAVDLAAAIINRLDFLPQFLSAFIVPRTASFVAQQRIIKSAPRYAQRIAEHMDAVLVMQIIERVQPVFQRRGRGAGGFLQDIVCLLFKPRPVPWLFYLSQNLNTVLFAFRRQLW